MSDHIEAVPVVVPELDTSVIAEQEEWHRPSIPEIWHMTDDDRAEGGRVTKIALAAMVVGLAVEWAGPNEILITNISDNTYKHSHSILHAAVNAGIFSFSLQTLVGLTIAAGISRFPKTIENLRTNMQRPEKAESDEPIVDANQGSEVEQITEAEDDNESGLVATLVDKAEVVGALALRGAKETAKPLVVGSGLNLVFEAPKIKKNTIPLNGLRILGWSAIVGAGVVGVVSGSLKAVQEAEIHNFAVNEVNVLVNDVLPNPIGVLALIGLAYGSVKVGTAAVRKVSPPIKNAYNHIASLTGKGLKSVGKLLRRNKSVENSDDPADASPDTSSTDS